ncbi:guanylate kinase [Clostridium sp. CAG:632]|jgi:guanylate kinase|nr:guanylate kinase [Lachnospiraceae bacterium]MBS6465181.1 guanylate kinase [Clostridium sp.]MDD6267285.1 guanylate kinase [Clostridium sp.]CCY57609.1 guanylate kinase [Clostridium sp. CAG:632]
MDKKGFLIVISGFSGVGKGTVVKRLVQDYGYSLSISATTRAPREGEVDGREYYFKTKEDFMNLIDYNGFIEWAVYVENYYGTPRAFVEKELAAGHNVILEIEVQGAMNIKEQYPDAILIFLTAPSAAELRNRLVGRGTEEAAVIEKRMQRAVEESANMESYEYIVVNDDLDQCVKDVNSVIVARGCMIEENKEFMKQMKAELKAL